MKLQDRLQPRRHEGFVLVFLAMTLVILLAFAALAVDMGALSGARTAAQRAADAAALAGAFVYITNSTLSEADLNQLAKDEAEITAVRNTILDHTIDLVADHVQVVPNAHERWVQVWITHHRETFFAKVLGWNVADIRVFAMAEAAVEGTTVKCAKPWFLPNTVMSTRPPCEAACSEPPLGFTGVWAPEVLFDDNGAVTDFGNSQVGQHVTLKVRNAGDAIGPGNFYAIRLGDSTGGNDYRLNIAICTAQSIQCGAGNFETETGAMVGPTQQGTVGQGGGGGPIPGANPPVLPLVEQPPDTYDDSPGHYLLDGVTPSTTSKQVVVIPVWDVKPYCLTKHTEQPCCKTVDPNDQCQLVLNGNKPLTIVGFMRVFVTGMTAGDVEGWVVGVSGCEMPDDWNIDPTEGGPYGIPLRLVRPATQPAPPT